MFSLCCGFYEIVQLPMPGFKQPPIIPGSKESDGIHTQVVTEMKDINDVSDSRADFLQSVEMNRHQGVKQRFD